MHKMLGIDNRENGFSSDNTSIKCSSALNYLRFFYFLYFTSGRTNSEDLPYDILADMCVHHRAGVCDKAYHRIYLEGCRECWLLSVHKMVMSS